MPHDPARRDVDAIAADLRQHGWCVVDAIEPDLVATLDDDLARPFAETPFCEGGFYGARTKRFGRLLTRSQLTDALVRHPAILAAATQVLAPYCDTIRLNLTQAIAVHPGALPQLPHRDDEMWRGPTGAIEYLVNVMWPLTAFAADNDATLVWPDSHGAAPRNVAPQLAPTVAEIRPGQALLFLGSTPHGAGGNVSTEIRRAIIISYCLGWLRVDPQR